MDIRESHTVGSSVLFVRRLSQSWISRGIDDAITHLSSSSHHLPPPVVDVKLPDGDFGCLLLKMTCRKINRETVRQKSQRTTIRME